MVRSGINEKHLNTREKSALLPQVIKHIAVDIVHKYFPECYQFDEQELNRIIASGMKSEQCQRIIEIVKKESAEKRENAVVKAESEVAGDEGTGKSENA